jgi:NAD(P)-dependent dehydrogenase (short-subunit alcohol dehydrogenase family)
VDLNLRGKTALVTGASKGIGFAAAECLAAEGVNVILISRTQTDLDVARQRIVARCNLQEVDEARWRAAWDLKVFGYINMCRRFYAAMKSRGRGVIINVLGMAGEKMDATYVAGSTGNAGLMAFTKALGGAASADNLRVVGINPGAIATERLVTMMKKRAQDRLGDAARWEELMKPLPFERAGSPDEIGHMVAFLASDLSAYTTGTIITIDGGVANRGPMF